MTMSLRYLPICTLLLTLCILQTLSIHPTPKYMQITEQYRLSESNICPNLQLHYTSDEVIKLMPIASDTKLQQSPGSYYFNKILQRHKLHSKCQDNTLLNNNAKINIHKIHLTLNKQISKQGYKITSKTTHVQLQFSSYIGYVYSLQTLSQMIQQNNIIKIGIIQDEPIVQYRGIMIDPVRHFISIKYIRNLILAMPLSKLNIIHWLFSNDQTFILDLLKHPQLSQASRYSQSQSYSIADVKQMIQLAKLNAVSIVPQFDTPGHVRSWGLAKQWQDKNITILCPGGQHYNHQFDLSKDDVYKLTADVLAEGDSLFRDSPYIHLGGDQVFGNCWDLRPAIKTFMALKNIKNYGELQMYWRYQLKQYLPNGRKVIFWRNDADNVTTGADDIVQYWGAQKDTATVTGKSQSKLILSPSDYLYLNKGTTWIWMNKTNGAFTTWRQIYLQFTVRPDGVDPNRILGAQVCLWNEIQNEDTFENQIWMRSSAFAAKIWRNQIGPLATLVKDLVALQKKLIGMGIQPSPITNQFCEIYPEKCYSTTTEELSEQILIQ